MDQLHIINPINQDILFCVLSCMGILSLSIGISVFRINGKKNICRRIMLFSIYNFVWCMGYAWMGVADSDSMAYNSRALAVLALHLWTANGPGLILDFSESQVSSELKKTQDIVLNILAIILGSIIAMPESITLTCASYGVCYYVNITLGRVIDFFFIFYCFIAVIGSTVLWYRKSQYRRNKICMYYVIVAMGTLPIGLSFDIVRPICKLPSLPGSCFTAALSMLFLYFAAYHLNVISISMKNIGEFLYRSVATPTIILNEHGYILLANEFSMDYIGASDSNVKGKRFNTYFNDDNEMFANYMNNIGDGKKVFSFRSTCTANNKVSGIEYSVVDDKYGECLCVIAIIYDLTEENKIMTQLQTSREEALKASEAKSRFLANMSHEIRTPINAILGMNEMILRESDNDDISEYSENIQSAGRSLLAIVNDILDISKIESGMMEINNVKFRLSSALSDVINIIKLRACQKNLDFNVDIDRNIPDYIESDETKIKQIITNLLSNAVKYTDRGKIDFTVGYEKISSDQIILNVSVSDTGIGIRNEDIDKIFKSFKRADDVRTRSIVGTGLGLNITKQILKMMGGSIFVKSIYGKGSVFSFKVPVRTLSTDIIGPAFDINNNTVNIRKAYEASFTAPEGKILVVDDNEMNLAVIKGLLKKTKLVVDITQSGVQCLKKIEQKHYDVIFLDHMMPNMDGIETFKKMKADEDNLCRNTPVIVLTANAISGARDEYIKEGFTDYIAKPVEGEQLETILIKYLPKEKVTLAKIKIVQQNNPADTKEVNSFLEDNGINVTKAIKYFNNSIEQFQEIIKVFYDQSMNKINILKQKSREEALGDYVILVHALKGNAKNIGATELQKIALEHENEAKEGNHGYVEAHWEELESEWNRVLDGIHEYLSYVQRNRSQISPKQQNIELSQDMVMDRIGEILRSIENFEDVRAEQLLKELLQYKLEPHIMEACNKCYESVNNFDYTMAAQNLNIIKQ